jgi:hypothetical protein
MPPRPGTGTVPAAIVGDGGSVLAARGMPAERRRAAALDGNAALRQLEQCKGGPAAGVAR